MMPRARRVMESVVRVWPAGIGVNVRRLSVLARREAKARTAGNPRRLGAFIPVDSMGTKAADIKAHRAAEAAEIVILARSFYHSVCTTRPRSMSQPMRIFHDAGRLSLSARAAYLSAYEVSGGSCHLLASATLSPLAASRYAARHDAFVSATLRA